MMSELMSELRRVLLPRGEGRGVRSLEYPVFSTYPTLKYPTLCFFHFEAITRSKYQILGLEC